MVGDFFCLPELCELAIQNIQRISLRITFVVTQQLHSDSQARYDESRPSNLGVKLLVLIIQDVYDADHAGLKAAFQPHLFGAAMSSVALVAKDTGFQKLMEDVPEFTKDWAMKLMASITAALPLPTTSHQTAPPRGMTEKRRGSYRGRG